MTTRNIEATTPAFRIPKNIETDYDQYQIRTSRLARELFERSAWDNKEKAIRIIVTFAFGRLVAAPADGDQIIAMQDGVPIMIQIEPNIQLISCWTKDEVEEDKSAILETHPEDCSHSRTEAGESLDIVTDLTVRKLTNRLVNRKDDDEYINGVQCDSIPGEVHAIRVSKFKMALTGVVTR